MSGKSMMVLGLAGLCGLGAMYGTSRLLSSTRGSAATEMRDVLVAARDLNTEELIKADTVKVVKMPRASVPSDGFTAAADVEDRWVQIKTLEGEPILNRKLAPKGNPVGLVSRIPKGHRAYAIEINEQTGVSGFVMPGHHVDVIQARAGSRQSEADAETILQDVLVLAAGQTVTRTEDKSILARTVTLAVTPEMVDTLVSARAQGPLSLSLRGLNDHESVKRPAPPAPRPKATAEKKGSALAESFIKLIQDIPLPPPPPPPNLDSKIRKGERAVSIEVKEHTGVAGFVLPNTWVDVIQLQEGKTGGAETVLQNLRVLSAGQTFTRADNPSIQCRTVTLAVTPEQGNTLVASHSRGPLTLALRGTDDHEPVKIAAPARPPTPPPSRYLSIYRGPEAPDRFRLADPSVASPQAPSGSRPAGPIHIQSPEARPVVGGDTIPGRTP